MGTKITKGNAKALCTGEGLEITDEDGDSVESEGCSLD